MSTLTLAAPPNGIKPPQPVSRLVPLMATKVDHLADLCATIKLAQEAERVLTGEVLAAMNAQGLRVLQGGRAMAVLDNRTSLRPDPELFHEAVGATAFSAMSVSVTAARKIMPAADLAAISETTTSQVLLVKPVGTVGVAQ